MVAWPGVVRARRVVRWADHRAESPLESVVRGRIVALDLPVPQHRFVVVRWDWRQAHDHDEVFRSRLLSAFARAAGLRS